VNQINTPHPEWYAVHVRSRHEGKVYERLISKGVETFFPTVERLRKMERSKKAC